VRNLIIIHTKDLWCFQFTCIPSEWCNYSPL